MGKPFLILGEPFLVMGEPILIMGEPPAASLLLFITEPMFDLTPGDAPAAPMEEVSTTFLHLFVSEPGIGLSPGQAPASLFLALCEPFLFMGGPIQRLLVGQAPPASPAFLFMCAPAASLLSEPMLELFKPVFGLAFLFVGEPRIGLHPVEAPASLPFLIMGEPIIGELIQPLLLEYLFLFMGGPIQRLQCEPIPGLTLLFVGKPIPIIPPVQVKLVMSRSSLTPGELPVSPEPVR